MTARIDASTKQACAPEEVVLRNVFREVPRWRNSEIVCERVSGGISNSNWRVTIVDQQRNVFVKIPGKGTEMFVNRQASNEAARKAHAAGLGPEVIHFDAASGVEISEFLDGYRPSTNVDFLDPILRQKVVSIYRELHRNEKLVLTKTIFDMIDEHFRQLDEVRGNTPGDFPWLQRQYSNVKQAFAASGLDIVPCFNDPMPGNFLIGKTGEVKLVDYEFASNNERHFDLGVWFGEMFFSENVSFALIEDYFGAVTPQNTARVFAMRALADLKWACWSMVQQRVSALDFDYYKYGTWKFIRARALMHDSRWSMWLRNI